jgi:hypothetical protein
LANDDRRLQQRCIVLFEGFYEWRQQQQQHSSSSSSSEKIAHIIRLHADFQATQHQGGAGSSHELLMIGMKAAVLNASHAHATETWRQVL